VADSAKKSPLSAVENGLPAGSSFDDQLARRWWHAVALLEDCVDVSPNRRGGVPCLKGTRVTVAQILAQLAEGDSVDDLVDDMEIDRDTLVTLLNGLSLILDRPAVSDSRPT
jgi:uncharacterized protein (DUF433 family)